jgi:ATP-dependent RNA helicase DHX29
MAGGKKKKKTASNPARGFATTSIASKPRLETVERAAIVDSSAAVVQFEEVRDDATTENQSASTNAGVAPAQLDPEEFERQLEESGLQVLVDKYSQKAKRDAARQITRLQTDRRLLRGQAEFLNTRKWLPSELIDEILGVISGDYRSSSQTTNESTTQKPLTEEDLIIKLWTLQQALDGAGFPDNRVHMALNYMLSISDKLVSGNKDSIWGLEESLQWLARECSRDELPDYENWQTKALQGIKSQTGSLTHWQAFRNIFSTVS